MELINPQEDDFYVQLSFTVLIRSHRRFLPCPQLSPWQLQSVPRSNESLLAVRQISCFEKTKVNKYNLVRSVGCKRHAESVDCNLFFN